MAEKIRVAHAIYRDPTLEIHRGNPLICALPNKIESQRLKKILTKSPVSVQHDGLSKTDRIQLVKQIRNFVIPTNPYLDFYNVLYGMLITGYESRNPVDARVVEWSYDIANPDISIEELIGGKKLTLGSDDTTSESVFLTGCSGIGKSKLKKAVLSSVLPNVILHNRDDFDEIQIVYLEVEMPHDGLRSTLLRNMFKAIDSTLKGTENTDYLGMVHSETGRDATAGTMESLLHSLCLKYHIGIIIIDEFQNINVASNRFFSEMLQLFDTLSNILDVPFIKIGTPDSFDRFKGKFRHGRRAGEIIEILPYKMVSSKKDKSAKDWRLMVSAIFSYQIIKTPLKHSDRVEAELYKLSAGIPYCLFKLWQEAQIEAILSGDEKLSLKLFKQVYDDKFKLIKIGLSALRKNKSGRRKDLLTVNQLIDKGETSVALNHLDRFAQQEQFSGSAAVELSKAVSSLEFQSDLTDDDKEKMANIKKVLKQRSQAIQKGQTIEHDDK